MVVEVFIVFSDSNFVNLSSWSGIQFNLFVNWVLTNQHPVDFVKKIILSDEHRHIKQLDSGLHDKIEVSGHMLTGQCLQNFIL